LATKPKAIRRDWTGDELKLAFHLYCQMPFGRMHKTTPEIVELANLIGRTPSAVAMKLVNFASLDPSITSTGRSGLGNTSKGDREVWQTFSTDLGRLDDDCELILDHLKPGRQHSEPEMRELAEPPASFIGETQQAVVHIRKRQDFFRRSILASYDGKCCMSGVTTPELLIASHIVPWSSDVKNRLNPRNGLCLSAIHDKAFDRGLITVTPDFSIRVSEKIKEEGQRTKLGKMLSGLEGEKIVAPKRFLPAPEFLQWHNDVCFEKKTNEPYDI